MFKFGFLRSCLLAVIGLLFVVVRPSAAFALTTENLLVNGDAELQRCTHDWTAQSSIPGWRVIRGAANVLCYSAFSVAAETPITPSNVPPGNALFSAPGADTAMEQVVDVSAAGSSIDNGKVDFRVSAWLGGWRDRPERATLTAVFLDGRGRSTGSPVIITNADAQARRDLTGLVQREANGLVPVSTRRIIVTVQFVSGMTSFENAYADNICLILSGDLGDLAPAAAMPPPARIPELDHVYVVMMENTNYSDVIHTTGTSVMIAPRMPFTAWLASRGVILSNMWGTYHPSDQNYVAMVAGDTYRYGPTYYPDYDLPVTHLGDLLDLHGKSWRAYVQNMNTPCNLFSHGGSGENSYSPDDQPFVHFQDVIGDRARCVADVRDLKDLASAISNNTLPDFAWIAADNWWNGEDAWYRNYDVGYSNAKQDQFLQLALQPLLQSAQWNESRSLLILTWDESGGWGWPDNHVPTIMVGSPGLLRAGTVMHEHVDGYDILRTIESALGVGSLGRFDQFAQPLNAIFEHEGTLHNRAAGDLWPTEAVATRGTIADTFGQITTPAAVDQGKPLTLVVPAGVDSTTVVNLEQLGHVPNAESIPYHFASDNVSVSIPTSRRAPGVYGAWLRRGTQPPYRAPMMVLILPPALVSPNNPGVEIIGAAFSGGDPADISIREGSNFVVRYCRPFGVKAVTSWIGIFAAGTPIDQMTKNNANRIGFWLKTAGGKERGACGEAAAYASELTPGEEYHVLLLHDTTQGESEPIGRTAAFKLTPALPH